MFFSVPSAPRRGTRAVRKAALSLPLIAMSLAGPPAAVASPTSASEVGPNQTSTNDAGANQIGPNEIGPNETSRSEIGLNETSPKQTGPGDTRTVPPVGASATSISLSGHAILLLPEGHGAYVFRHITPTTVTVNTATHTTRGQTAKHLAAGQGSVKPEPAAKAQASTKAKATPVAGRKISADDAQPVAPVRIFVGNFLVTCYDLTGHTATGAVVSLQSVAVDPSVIPLGTEIYVPGAGVRTADDTGGFIIGHRLDIWEPTYSDCADWGAEEKPVYRITR